MFQRVRKDNNDNIMYVFFDTGIEYEATKEHLDYLENKYGITIQRCKPVKPVPLACKQYGVPFISKMVSQFISRLQQHNFKWEDKPYSELVDEYPNCRSALRWWCNENGEKSNFNIRAIYKLKEFMITHPPWFAISEMCCTYAKKRVAKHLLKGKPRPLLNCVGMRKSEGGIRSLRYKNCFSPVNDNGVANYRPLFFVKNPDKKIYERTLDIQHSRCYTEYGLQRTGCAGCPFGKKFEEELNIIQQYEPKLYKAVNNIFKDSYTYTRMYEEFKRECREQRLEDDNKDVIE